MSEWISVKERLPALHVSVLIFRGTVYVGSWSGHRWHDSDGYRAVFGITHWMQLPEPPRDSK